MTVWNSGGKDFNVGLSVFIIFPTNQAIHDQLLVLDNSNRFNYVYLLMKLMSKAAFTLALFLRFYVNVSIQIIITFT